MDGIIIIISHISAAEAKLFKLYIINDYIIIAYICFKKYFHW